MSLPTLIFGCCVVETGGPPPVGGVDTALLAACSCGLALRICPYDAPLWLKLSNSKACACRIYQVPQEF